MSTTNEVWMYKAGQLHRLDLPEDTALLPSFQANDRTRPDSIQSEYSPEFEAAGSAHNHWLLGHAAASQPTQGAAYVRVPAVLTSGGVEIMPLALLYIKGFKGGRYQLQLFGGNRRFVEALGEKTLADLDLNGLNHLWTPANIAARLPYAYWAEHGYGYEVYDRGKPVDWQELDPYQCYPSIASSLVFEKIIAEAGFTADNLRDEPLFAAQNIPTATPFTYDSEARDAHSLTAGWRYQDGQAFSRNSEFAPLTWPFNFISQAPYQAGHETVFSAGRVTIGLDGYYSLRASLACVFGCEANLPGEVSMKVSLAVNGVIVGEPGEKRVGAQASETLTAKADRIHLKPTDTVEVMVQGDEWPNPDVLPHGPVGPYWRVGYVRGLFDPPYDPAKYHVETENRFEVTLLEEFPQGGLIKLQDWLPKMKQLDFIKSQMLLLGLTIQTDDYRPHLHLSPGYRLIENVGRALNWTEKRDAYAPPGQLPERDLSFSFGGYARHNTLRWAEDELVAPGYGDGQIMIADERLSSEYELAVLPFAATEPSSELAGFLRIQNYRRNNFEEPATYDMLSPQPRLTLRATTPEKVVRVVISPRQEIPSPIPLLPPMVIPAVYQKTTTTPSYFAGQELSLMLNEVLGKYWVDLKSMLDESRYLVEYYRLSPADVAALSFDIPIWDNILGDYFAVSKVVEYSDSHSTEVHLVRLNAKYLPAPTVPGEEGVEFSQEFYSAEFY